MALKIGIQMDHVSTINIEGDSTFALSIEAQNRGYELFHYTPDKLQFRGGRVSALLEPMTLRETFGDHYSLGASSLRELSDLDVILLRQDPPFDMSYITTTHLLERVHPETLVVNDPASVRNAPEKILVMDFPDLMPETLITRNLDAIIAFSQEFKDIIL
ncbi:MAG: glutathione synthase, partial [Rhizobiaceae bacterium]|nr:glutathione synthase [Rhizobiaceae bacterium]